MRKIRELALAVERFLDDFGRPYFRKLLDGLPDGRGLKGRERKQVQFLTDAVAAKLGDVVTLRALEQMTALSRGGCGGLLAGGRMPDSTLSEWLQVTGTQTGNGLLVRMASDLHARKMLEPNPEVLVGDQPAFLASFDGKVSFVLMEPPSREEEGLHFRIPYQVTRKMADGSTKESVEYYWHVKFVRAVVATQYGPIAVGLGHAKGDDEPGAVRRLCQALTEDSRWMRNAPTVVTGDAAQMNRDFVLQLGDPYNEIRFKGKPLTGLGLFYAIKVKDGCPALRAEALRAGLARIQAHPTPDATDGWKEEGHGRRVKREAWLIQTARGRGLDEKQAARLDDSEEVAHIDQKDWPTIRQFLIVKQTVFHSKPPKDGSPQEAFEYRLLATNIKRVDVTAKTLLNIIRLEWQVEVHHNIIDVVMHEDKGIWSLQGQAPAAMAAINSIAANLLVLLKKRRLRSDFARETLSYPQLMFLIRYALLQRKLPSFLRAEKRTEPKRKRPHVPDLPPPVEHDCLPPEYTRTWSDNDVALLLGAMQSLFRSLAALYGGEHSAVTLGFHMNADSKEVEIHLQVD